MHFEVFVGGVVKQLQDEQALPVFGTQYANESACGIASFTEILIHIVKFDPDDASLRAPSSI